MDDQTRMEKLAAAISGSGATVNDPRGVWALYTSLDDSHLERLRGWADLEFLIADGSLITNHGLGIACEFRGLTELSIGGTAVSSDAIAGCDFPPNLHAFGCGGIELAGSAAANIATCTDLVAINANHCLLSMHDLALLAALPRLTNVDALGTRSQTEEHAKLSREFPTVTFLLDDGLWLAGDRKPIAYRDADS